jgi:hypothetical protein
MQERVCDDVVLSRNVENMKIKVIVNQDIHCGDEDAIVRRLCQKGGENVESIGVIGVDDKAGRPGKVS